MTIPGLATSVTTAPQLDQLTSGFKKCSSESQVKNPEVKVSTRKPILRYKLSVRYVKHFVCFSGLSR